MMKTEDLFVDTPIVPVVVIDDIDQAVPLAKALISAGIGVIEITLRTDAAFAAIEQVARECPDICVGAGSIRSATQIGQVMDAGARFCVSPGFSDGLLIEADARDAHLIPGAGTAAEALQLYERGYDFVKFFPAEVSGGLRMIKALSAPLPEISFFPTGGITAELAVDYLGLDCVRCVGGSWFVSPDRVRAGDFSWITAQASAALRILSDRPE